MATILASTNSDGTRRCDGTCHNAKHPRCHCICGGRYHGKGSAAAQAQLMQDWTDNHCADVKATLAAQGRPMVLTPTQLSLQLDTP